MNSCFIVEAKAPHLVGDQLLKLMVEAIPEAAVHAKEFKAFDGKLRRERPDDVRKWEEMVLAWEADRRNAPSPFTIKAHSTSSLNYSTCQSLTVAFRCHSSRCATPPPHGGKLYFGQ